MVCVCFINIWFFAPGFECFTGKSGFMHIVVAEAKKLTVVDYFIVFCRKVFSTIELLGEVSDWYGWIPTYSCVVKIGCEIGVCDGSLLSV